MRRSVNLRKLGITVFFPCYNDSKSIGILVRKTFKILSKLTTNHEIIVVDDGSYDDSREVLKILKNEYKKLRLIFHKKNLGYGILLPACLSK